MRKLKMKQKQIILQNNIIDISQQVLKNDKEREIYYYWKTKEISMIFLYIYSINV